MTKDEKAAYWRQQVDGFQASGLSTKHYCAREGIAVATLMSWNQSLWIGTLRLIPGARRARLVVTQGINPVMQINRSSHLCHPFGRYPRPALGKSLHR